MSTGGAYSMLRGADRLAGKPRTVITEVHRARVIEVFDAGGSVNQAASASKLTLEQAAAAPVSGRCWPRTAVL